MESLRRRFDLETKGMMRCLVNRSVPPFNMDGYISIQYLEDPFDQRSSTKTFFVGPFMTLLDKLD